MFYLGANVAKVITITIDENADQVVETDGYHGKGCSAVTYLEATCEEL